MLFCIVYFISIIFVQGIVPTHADKFRLYFPCTGKVAEQVETLFQVRKNLFPFIDGVVKKFKEENVRAFLNKFRF